MSIFSLNSPELDEDFRRPSNQSSVISKKFSKTYSKQFYKEKNLKQITLTYANQITQINFIYLGPHVQVLYNRDLRVKNQIDQQVLVRVKCNNPPHYDVRPVNFSLKPGQIISISIQLKLNQNDLSLNSTLQSSGYQHDLSRYENDAFKIQYFPIRESHYQNGYKLFPVKIKYTQQNQHESQNTEMKKKQQKIMMEERQVNIYNQLKYKNQSQIQVIQNKIGELHKELGKDSLISRFTNKTFIIAIGILGFSIGFYLA